MEAVWYGAVAAFAFLGLVSVIYYIILWIYRPRGKCKYVITVTANTEKGEIGRQVYGSHLRNLIFGDLIGEGIILFNCGLNEEDSRALDNLAEEYGAVIADSADELCNSLKDDD